MNVWSNIEVLPEDPEILKIDKFEKTLGNIPSNVRHIRELITGFEVCHFKYQHHLKYIKNSIVNLKPNTVLKKIGSNHIRNGENAWKNDNTGRSLLGQKYVWATSNWLGVKPLENNLDYYNQELGQQITKWLGKKNNEKERLVCLLIARLTWDWKSYEKFRQDEKNDKLEFQVCRMDICHYAFPENLDLILQGIGKMKPVEAFEGCGSCNSDIKKFIKGEFNNLNNQLQSFLSEKTLDKSKQVKAWLTVSLAKTLKEQTGLKKSLIGLKK